MNDSFTPSATGDSEADCIAMLIYVVEQSGLSTQAESRIAAWFYSRYEQGHDELSNQIGYDYE